MARSGSDILKPCEAAEGMKTPSVKRPLERSALHVDEVIEAGRTNFLERCPITLSYSRHDSVDQREEKTAECDELYCSLDGA
jgi:hypothetical protein